MSASLERRLDRVEGALDPANRPEVFGVVVIDRGGRLFVDGRRVSKAGLKTLAADKVLFVMPENHRAGMKAGEVVESGRRPDSSPLHLPDGIGRAGDWDRSVSPGALPAEAPPQGPAIEVVTAPVGQSAAPGWRELQAEAIKKASHGGVLDPRRLEWPPRPKTPDGAATTGER